MRAAAVGVMCLMLSGCGGGSAGTGLVSETNLEPKDAELVVLRLNDLPKGFRIGDDGGCGEFGVEGASDRLAEFVMRRRPSGCLRELNYVWAARSGVPLVVESAATVLADAKAAKEALQLRKDLLAFTLSSAGELENEKAESGLGDESLSFTSGNSLVRGQTGQPGAGVAWRSGNVVNAVFEGGLAGDKGRAAAVDLAHKQQDRLDHLTPVPRTETDDREISIDDPDLELPVYWLGREFDPAGDLPSLELVSAVSQGPEDGPGNLVKIDYSGGVTLDLWTPESWARFKGTRLGRMVWSWPCTKSKMLPLAGGGKAIIYAGYAEPKPSACPSQPPDRYLAHVYLDGVVAAVNMPYCYMCASRGRGVDPYNSLEGMEAIVKGLRRR